MDLILGLDIGTTEIKALSWDSSCYPHGRSAQKIRLSIPQSGWVEQDAEEIWAAVCKVCAQVAQQATAAGDTLCAIGLSTQGGTIIPVDDEGKPTHPSISWMDERAEFEMQALKEAMGGEEVYQKTGWHLMAGLPFNQIVWLHRHCPENFQKTSHFRFVNDFILERFSGVACMDPSNAEITQLYNLSENDWDHDLMAYAGIVKEQFAGGVA